MNVATDRTWVSLAVLLTLLGGVAWGGTLNVPADFDSIQSAIDAAENGDVVLVSPGTYFETLDFLGKAITVLSGLGPDVTIIDARSSGSVVTFSRGEGRDSILDGFTLSRGSGTKGNGGGIICDGSSPIIRNNTVRQNWVPGRGGGIACSNGSAPLIENNTITFNVADNFLDLGDGGGIAVLESSPVITQNEIVENFTVGGGGAIYVFSGGGEIVGNSILRNCGVWETGGIYCWNSAPLLSGNFIVGNEGYGGGGISAPGSTNAPLIANNLLYLNEGREGGISCSSNTVLVNNTIVANSGLASGVGGISCEGSPGIVNCIIRDNLPRPQIEGKPILTFCNVSGGWPGEGNIDLPPQFVDALNGDFHLASASPCINTGSHLYLDLPASDFEGDPRVACSFVDMGFDEVQECPGHLFVRGDIDGDGEHNLLVDILFLLNYGFLGGRSPRCQDAADVDDNGTINALIDALYLFNYGFSGGDAPPPPLPGCGSDPSCDDLTCEVFLGCL